MHHLLQGIGFSKQSTFVKDRVRCYCCKIEKGWEHGDGPFAKQKKWSPTCRFVRLVERIYEQYGFIYKSDRVVCDESETKMTMYFACTIYD